MSVPVLFNGLKHHCHALRSFIRKYDTSQLTELSLSLLTIGGSQMDLYQGELPEAAICQEVIHYLTELNALSEPAYQQFLLPEQYKTIVLSDTSQWVLRLGEKETKYVHIHPGRFSPYTLRVKAATLKTAIALLIWQKGNSGAVDTATLNYLRKDVLHLSPVRKMEEMRALSDLTKLLSSDGEQ
ncbi:hypothetical protein IC235_19220 [Hymenobacter sp. BT664]|uniref:Uncharacterized protein n=1 Tax=Hymenobacter montanus TaxID=2771359 RepID=A0A927BH96_9BACT|nr:hypothetical protein [Hymenobacter montanus]MBD2770024.1 hypothetical protein [Hymenobacter montanus]